MCFSEISICIDVRTVVRNFTLQFVLYVLCKNIHSYFFLMSNEGQISYSRVLLSGAGFFADAYDLFVINIAVDIMSKVSYEESLTTEVKSAIKSMALAGAIVGQLLFGSLADLIGRRKIFITTCVLVIVGAICSSQAQDTKGSFGIYSQIIFWRFILGLSLCL